MTKEQAVKNAQDSTVTNEMTNEEMIKALIQYGNTRYPKIEVERTIADSQGIGMKTFIESLSYGDQKRDENVS